MQHLPLIAQFHPPHMPILLRPALRAPQILKPRLTGLLQFPRLVIDREGERTAVGEIQPGFLQSIAILPGSAIIAPIRLSMTPTLERTRDKITLLIQLLYPLPPGDIRTQID